MDDRLHRRIYRLPSTFPNEFSSKTAGPIQIKVHMEPREVGGTNICSIVQEPMIYMDATPAYGKISLKSLLGTKDCWPCNFVYNATVTRILPILFK